MNEELVQCDQHGLQGFGLVCQHLSKQTNDLGFHQQEVGDIKPDAWCNDCNTKLQDVTNDKDQEQWFLNCDYKILCACCWDEAKDLNQ